MAKKAKKAKQAKVDVSFYRQVLRTMKKEKPKTAGLLIRARLVEGKMSADQISAECRKTFKGSTCKPSDVYWNRGKLKREGIKLGNAKLA